MEHFFLFHCSYLRSAMEFRSNKFIDLRDLFFNESVLKEDVIFHYSSGSKVYDLLGIGWSSCIVVYSVKVIQLFEENGITGWRKYPCKVLGKKGEEIGEYYLLSITGTCGPIDYISRFTDSNNPGKVEVEMVKGVKFDESTWNGSDLFIPKDTGMLFVTQRVRDLLVKNKITNMSIIPIEEYKSFYSFFEKKE